MNLTVAANPQSCEQKGGANATVQPDEFPFLRDVDLQEMFLHPERTFKVKLLTSEAKCPYMTCAVSLKININKEIHITNCFLYFFLQNDPNYTLSSCHAVTIPAKQTRIVRTGLQLF